MMINHQLTTKPIRFDDKSPAFDLIHTSEQYSSAILNIEINPYMHPKENNYQRGTFVVSLRPIINYKCLAFGMVTLRTRSARRSWQNA